MGSTAIGAPFGGKEAPKATPNLTSTVLVGLLAVLPAFTNVRISAFQPEDVALLFLLGFSAAKFLYSGFFFQMEVRLVPLFKSYSLFLLILVLLSIASVRLPFFSLEDASFFKQPLLFSFSKLLQLFAVIAGFFWLADTFSTNRKLLIGAMKAYWFVGVLIALFSLVCFLFLLATHFDLPEGSLLGAYYTAPGVVRARGIFNEGGPYGIYVASVFVVGFLLRHVTGRKLGIVNVILLSSAFILSSSKAGFCVVFFLCLYWILSTASFSRKLTYLIFFSLVLFLAGVSLDFDQQVSGYVDSYQNLEEVIATRGLDFNVVVGRVSALYIVPRMIEAHPVSGIGYGNYPLMRNDPRYLGILPAVRQAEDIPGIGFPGIAAEIGIPSTIWLIILLLVPVWMSKRKARILQIAGIFQLFAHAFAVQLTFFYPWFVSACVIAALSYEDMEYSSHSHAAYSAHSI